MPFSPLSEAVGSPPRMRGAFRWRDLGTAGHRITPAHAGSMLAELGLLFFLHGSPPRMRGALDLAHGPHSQSRITPAHAGSIAKYQNRALPRWDHPRACGEHFPCVCYGKHRIGSPPRMRGAFCFFVDHHLVARITPAHAGSISSLIVAFRYVQDHPRACGEHLISTTSVLGRSGSPPRMRGASPPAHHQGQGAGITPAHAGSIYLPRRCNPG